MSKILVLPGGEWQVPLMKKIKEMGHKPLVINPIDDSPCFAYAYKYLKADIFDWDRVISFAKTENVDAVVTDSGDIAVTIVAKICKELGLTSINEDMAHLYTNKIKMREFCKDNHLPHPDYHACKNIFDAVDSFNTINNKAIMKPIDSYSSKGVFTIASEQDIYMHFEESLLYSKSEKKVILEQYIEGTEFTVDGVKTPTNYYPLAISEKKHFSHNENVANELLFTYNSDKYDYDKLRLENTKFVMASGLKYGLIHAEYKYNDGEFYLIEIGARGGGNAISPVITNYMSGYDTQRYLIDCSLGKIFDYDFSIRKEHQAKAAVLKFFETPKNGGFVKKIYGKNKIASHPNIKMFELYFGVGDEIEKANTDASRIGYYIACADSKKELLDTMEFVKENFKIVI